MTLPTPCEPGAQQRRRPGDHATPSRPVLPRSRSRGAGQLVGRSGWRGRFAAVGLVPGAGPRRCPALAATGTGSEHRQRARLPVPRSHGGAYPDRGVAEPPRTRPAGTGGYRLAGGGKVSSARPDRHHSGRRHMCIAPARRQGCPCPARVGELRGPRQGQNGAGSRQGDRPGRISQTARTA
jgi:hypothetical protein